jgi:hypothetical protein
MEVPSIVVQQSWTEGARETLSKAIADGDLTLFEAVLNSNGIVHSGRASKVEKLSMHPTTQKSTALESQPLVVVSPAPALVEAHGRGSLSWDMEALGLSCYSSPTISREPSRESVVVNIKSSL